MHANMYIDTTKDIRKSVAMLREGRLVAFPTGTSYGLAADALQGHALQRLRNIKKRPDEKTFTVFLDTSKWDEFLKLSSSEKEFLTARQKQPLTLLVEPNKTLMHLAQNNLIGLRVVDHPLMEELAAAYLSPLTATSANISGEEACFSSTCIQQKFPGKINETTYDLSLGCILDAGELLPSQPSTIVQLINDDPKIIRPGAFEL